MIGLKPWNDLRMCLNDFIIWKKGIYNDGFADGISIGKAEGKAEGKIEGAILNALKVVKNLITKGFSLEEALAIADIDKETYEKYSAKENWTEKSC